MWRRDEDVFFQDKGEDEFHRDAGVEGLVLVVLGVDRLGLGMEDLVLVVEGTGLGVEEEEEEEEEEGEGEGEGDRLVVWGTLWGMQWLLVKV